MNSQGLGVAAAGGVGGAGGGIAINGADVGFGEGTIADNRAGDAGVGDPTVQGAGGGAGGGVSVVSATLSVARSTLSGNVAGAGANVDDTPGGAVAGDGGAGGAIQNTGSGVGIVNTTISGNAAGGGGSNPRGDDGQGGRGGAIHTDASTSFESVTIAGNSSGRDGAGLLARGGGISGTGQMGLSGVLLSANAPQNCDPDSNQIASNGFDIDFPASPCPGVEANPLLGPLADNGGPTLTLLPGAGSPALDRIPAGSAVCRPVDQRGIARPQGAACDIGAVEPVPPAPPGGPGGGARRGGAPRGGGSGGGAPAGSGPTDRKRPLARIRFLPQRLRATLRRGLAARVTTDEPGTAQLEVFVDSADARRVRGARRIRVARGTKGFATAGGNRVVAKFGRAAKRRLLARKRVRFVVRLRITDLAGNRATLTVRRTLRR